MNESMIMGLKHLHILTVVLFLISYSLKSGLMLSNRQHTLDRFRKKILLPEILLSVIFLVTGFTMWQAMGFSSIGGWFHIKLTLVVIAIPLGIIGFRRKNKALALTSTLIFYLVFILAWFKPQLFS